MAARLIVRRRVAFTLTLTSERARLGRFAAAPLAALAFWLAASLPAVAGDIAVEVTGIANDKGDVHVALYDRADVFPNSDGMLSERVLVIKQGRARTVFNDLPAGRYAVAAYHDENGNHDFDQGLFGIPLEGFGFSNGARAFFGPPSFESAAVDIPGTGGTITVDLGN